MAECIRCKTRPRHSSQPDADLWDQLCSFCRRGRYQEKRLAFLLDPGVKISDNYIKRSLFKKRKRKKRAYSNRKGYRVPSTYLELEEVARQLNVRGRIPMSKLIHFGQVPFQEVTKYVNPVRADGTLGKSSARKVVLAKQWDKFVRRVRAEGWPHTLLVQRRDRLPPIETLMTSAEVRQALAAEAEAREAPTESTD